MDKFIIIEGGEENYGVLQVKWEHLACTDRSWIIGGSKIGDTVHR